MWQALFGANWVWAVLTAIPIMALLAALLGFVRLVVTPPPSDSKRDDL